MEGSSEHEDLIAKMTKEVIDDIGKDIENKVLGVGKGRKIGDILEGEEKRKKHSQKQGKNSRLNYESLDQLKQLKIAELKEIQRNQSILKRSQMLNRSNISRSYSKLEISRFTDEEIKNIKEIKKRQRRFQKDLKEKERKMEEWVEEKKVEEEQLRKNEIGEKNQLRRKEITVQIEDLKRKRQERTAQHQIQMKNLKQLKAKKYLYHHLEQQPRPAVRKDETEKLKSYEQWKQLKKSAVVNIETHERDYLQHLKQQELKRGKHFEESLSYSKTETIPFALSKIYFKVKKEEEEQIKLQEWQKNTKENNISKQRMYSKQVKELFLPKLTTKPNNRLEIKENRNNGKKALDHHEQHTLGNQYMKNVHTHITKEQISKEKQSLLMNPQVQGGYSAFYKNYLKDIKDGNPNRQSQPLNFRAFKDVFENDEMGEEKRLKKAIRMIELQENKFSRPKDAQLVDSIKSKMLVLNKMIR